MATTMVKRGEEDNIITYEHYCDTFADRATIDPKYINLGTRCIVLEDETSNGALEVYISNSEKRWIKV